MADSENLPLECSDPAEGQSVPCPEPSALPGPTCDPDGTLPQLANEPEQQEVINLPPGPNNDPSCWNPKVGYKQEPVPGVPGATATGPGIQLRIGECGTDDNGNLNKGSFDLNGEASAGKLTYKNGSTTTEIEGANAKGGIAFNSKGENRIGAQINTASGSTEIAGPNGSTKVGLSSGVGFEARVHNGALKGNGIDIGPYSYDGKQRMPR